MERVGGAMVVIAPAGADGTTRYVSSATPDGGVFSFGDAPFLGSVASVGLAALNAPVVGMATSSDGAGYALATADGDVIPFGDGVAGGGLGGLRAPIVGIASP